MNITIISKIEKGKFKQNRPTIENWIKANEGKEVEITFKLITKKRSLPQVKFYRGVIVPIVKNCLLDAGIVLSAESVHDMLRVKFLKETVCVNETTGEVVERVRTTSELTTVQMNKFWEEIRLWVSEFWGVDIPEPNEEITLNFDK